VASTTATAGATASVELKELPRGHVKPRRRRDPERRAHPLEHAVRAHAPDHQVLTQVRAW
jgi:hypothetical protein